MAPTGKLPMKRFRKYSKILRERKGSLKLERVRLIGCLKYKVAESRVVKCSYPGDREQRRGSRSKLCEREQLLNH